MNKQKTKLHPTQFGRSMTEMLGVLAIIGILSICALVGYQIAIAHYKANETINELTARAISVTQERLTGKLSGFMGEYNSTTRLGYPATAYLLDDQSYFEIQLEQVPVDVCKQILHTNWKSPLSILVNDVSYTNNVSICETDDDNTPTIMDFQFKMDLDENAAPFVKCKSDADCQGPCTACIEEQCTSTCVGTERCAQDMNSGQMLCCPKEKREGPYCCETKVNGRCCNKYNQCCPWYQPLIDKNGNCYTCEHAVGVDVTGVIDNCTVCPNRELVGNMCIPNCPADKPIRDTGYKCHACDEEKPFIAPKECYKCPNRILGGLNRNYCALPCGEGIYADKPLMESYGHCHSCDENSGIRVIGVEENCSTACPNRKAYGYICSKICPDDKPLPSYSNGCLSCDDKTPAHVFSSKVACGLCPERIMKGDFCILPCGKGANEDLPLTDSAGKCHSCFEEKALRVNAAGCAVCSNRVSMGMACILPCPANKPFVGPDGTCYACEEPTSIFMDFAAQSCSKCPNRILQGTNNNYCALPCDEGIYDGMPLVGNNGTCYACDESKKINVNGTPENCLVCDNRHLETLGSTTYCVLNE